MDEYAKAKVDESSRQDAYGKAKSEAYEQAMRAEYINERASLAAAAAQAPKVCRRKYTITDYAHRRPKILQKKKAVKDFDPHRQQFYYGIKGSNVTRHLGCAPPSHAYHPSLLEAPPPSFHRRSSSITENVLGAVHVKRFDPKQPDPWFNRQATDVTEQLRFVPPSHATTSTQPDPWFGRARTYVTNPDVDDFSMFQNKSKAPEKVAHDASHAHSKDQQYKQWEEHKHNQHANEAPTCG